MENEDLLFPDLTFQLTELSMTLINTSHKQESGEVHSQILKRPTHVNIPGEV